MCLHSQAQISSAELKLISIDSQQHILKHLRPKVDITDSITALRTMQEVVASLQFDGYITASLDSAAYLEETHQAFIYVGPRFRWGEVAIKSAPGSPAISKSKKKFEVVSRSGLELSFGKLIERANNHGYPFARLKFDSISIRNGIISGDLLYDAGPVFKFDSLKVNGTPARRNYLSSYLRIWPASLFSERKFRQIQTSIDNLDYYTLRSPVQLIFHNNNANVQIDVERVKSSRFDGIVGILPNSSTSGRTLLTGEINLDLLNPFETGKELRLHWRRLKEESQFLDVGLHIPYFLRSPLGLLANFKLLKEDTTFINRSTRLGVTINASPKSDFSFFSEIKSANLLSTELIDLSSGLPENLDFRLNRYGGTYLYSNLSRNDILDEGVRVNVEASVGNKRIRRNANVDEQVYESFDNTTVLYQFDLAMVYRQRLRGRLMLNYRFSTGHIINPDLFRNDLFRLGGLNTIRGFNENSFFASNYGVSNVELRLIVDAGTYLFTFYDQAYINTNVGTSSEEDWPLGFGFGLQLSTRSGNFRFAYALGRSDDQPLNFNLSKIHFGIVNSF